MNDILPWYRLVGARVACRFVGTAWYVDDSPHLAEGRAQDGDFCEQARLVKTVKVSIPIAKWGRDQTVGSQPGG